MLTTEPVFRPWHFETASTTLVPVPGPPTLPNNRELVFLAQPLLRGRHLLGSVAVRASRIAVARKPPTWSDWLAVDLAKSSLLRTGSFQGGFSGHHNS